MRNFNDGWSAQHWADIEALTAELLTYAHALSDSVGSGGGSFTPPQLLDHAAKIEALTKHLQHIGDHYIYGAPSVR